MPLEIGELIQLCQRGDAFAQRKLEEIWLIERVIAKSSPWHKGENTLLRYKGAAYIPLDKALQLEIMRINHNDTQGGHFSVKRTLDAIQHKYF